MSHFSPPPHEPCRLRHAPADVGQLASACDRRDAIATSQMGGLADRSLSRWHFRESNQALVRAAATGLPPRGIPGWSATGRLTPGARQRCWRGSRQPRCGGMTDVCHNQPSRQCEVPESVRPLLAFERGCAYIDRTTQRLVGLPLLWASDQPQGAAQCACR